MKQENEKFLNFEQAINKIKEDEKTKPAAIHKEAQDQDISLALEPDRRRFLEYSIGLLEEVDSDLGKWLPENIRTIYSKKDMALLFRGFLKMKIDMSSNRRISKLLGVPENIVDNIEILAIEAVKRAIEKKRKNGIPIIGVN